MFALKIGAVGEWIEIVGRRENDPLILLGELRKALGFRSDQQLRAVLHRHGATRVDRRRHGKRLYVHVVDLLRALAAEQTEAHDDDTGVPFRTVPRYRCPLCDTMLTTYPCPACLASGST